MVDQCQCSAENKRGSTRNERGRRNMHREESGIERRKSKNKNKTAGETFQGGFHHS